MTHTERVRVSAEDRLRLAGEVPEDVRVFAEELRLDLARLAGAQDELADLRHTVREVHLEVILDFVVQLVVEGRVLDLDEELHIRRVRLLGTISQQEAGRAAANDCRDVRYTIHAYQVFLQLLRCAFAFFDSGTLRQPVINHQLRSRRVREEAL